jgi:hypothetical protein
VSICSLVDSCAKVPAVSSAVEEAPAADDAPAVSGLQSDPRDGRTSRSFWLSWAVPLFAIFLAFSWSSRGRWSDDTYITLAYARNLAEHHVWGFLPGRAANTATSPLNVVLEAAFGWAFHSFTLGLVILTAALYALLALLLMLLFQRLFRAPLFGVTTAVLFAVNPLLLSTIGLESLPFAVILVAGLNCFLYERWNLLALFCGLAILTRPDGVLYGIVMAVLVAATVPGTRRRLFRVGLFSLIVLLAIVPWYWYSWRNLGGFLPDTLWIKRGQNKVWYDYSFGNGFSIFYRVFPLAVVSSILLLPFAGLVLWNRSRPVRLMAGALLSYGLLHFLAYTALSVPPYHWYYTPEVVVLILLGSFGFATWVQTRPRHKAPLGTAIGGVVLVSVVAVVNVPAGELPVHSNWATARDYRTIGMWLSANIPPSETIGVIGEVGTIGYYSGLTTVNDFTDVNLATTGIRLGPDAQSENVLGRLIRFNIRHRPAPPALPQPHYQLVFARPTDSRVIVHEWDVGTRWRPGSRCYLIRV